MAAGWSNKVTNVLLTVCGEQNIHNQINGIMRNKVVYEKVSATLQEHLPSFFATFSPFSHHLVFVLQPNDAKPKNSMIKVVKGTVVLKHYLIQGGLRNYSIAQCHCIFVM